MRRLLIASLLVAFLALPAWALAAEGDLSHVQSRAEAMKRLEMVRLYKMVEVLELDSDESARLFPMVQKYDKQFRGVVEKIERAYIDLHEETKADQPDKKKLRNLVSTIFDLEREAMKVRDAQYRELRKELNDVRVAKFLLFEKHFQREMNRILDDVRGKRRMRMKMKHRKGSGRN